MPTSVASTARFNRVCGSRPSVAISRVFFIWTEVRHRKRISRISRNVVTKGDASNTSRHGNAPTNPRFPRVPGFP